MPWKPQLGSSLIYSPVLLPKAQPLAKNRCKVGCGPALSGSLMHVGSDRDWANLHPPAFGIFPLIGAAIAGVVGAVSSAASAAAPVVAAVGSAATVASTVSTGIEVAGSLLAAGGATPPAPVRDPVKAAKHKKERDALRKKGEAKLAEVMVRARKGDPEAQAIVAGIKILTSKPMQAFAATTKFQGLFNKLPTAAIVEKAMQTQLQASAGKDWKSFVRNALAAAKKSGQWASKPAKELFPVDQMKAAAKTAAKAEVKKRALAGGSKHGAAGYLVTQNGKIMRGNWLPGAKG